jgi:hypothetical protein
MRRSALPRARVHADAVLKHVVALDEQLRATEKL